MSPNHKEIRKNIKKIIKYREYTDDDLVIIPDIVGRNIFRLDHLQKLAKEKNLNIIDCGAHIGVFSLLASYYFPKYKIHAFEPNPDSFKYLKENAEKRKNIIIYNKAVGYKDSTMKLYQPKDSARNGSWTVIPQGARHIIGKKSIEVDVINLYNFIEKLNEPVFILKLDLEGFEAEIINRFPTKLLKKIKIILLEEHEIPIIHDILKKNKFVVAFNPSNSQRQFVYVNTDNNQNTLFECFEMYKIITRENYREKYKELEAELKKYKFQKSVILKFTSKFLK